MRRLSLWSVLLLAVGLSTALLAYGAATYGTTVSVDAITAVGLPAIPWTVETPNRAFLSVEGASIRFWYDGQTPTAVVGHPASSGSTIIITGQDDCRRFKMIAQSGTATITVTLHVGEP